ncbi:hypothetical protein ACMT9Y_14520 [Clavibacter tessellarius]|uniref:hypothetical protein n=1 Tax=Clavibacter tessellarius TaxID=31965 RepID=UPI0039EC874B
MLDTGAAGPDEGDGMDGAGRIIVNPGPADHPLRPWVAGDEDGAVDLSVIVDATGARPALGRLHRGETLDDRDLAVLGVANFQAYLMTYEPLAALMPDGARPHPALVELMPRIADAS